MYWILAVFHLVIMPVAAIHALICKRDHRAALGWIGVIVLFPVAGPLLYFLFGINRVRSKAQVFAGHHLPVLHFGYERATRVLGEHREPLLEQVSRPHLAIVGGRATRQPLVAGNRLTLLFNGDEFFPRLIEQIDAATDCVCVSSYLFSPKGSAGRVSEALSRAAQRGVQVRVLIDGLGAWYSWRRALKPLRRAGVTVALFRPPSLLPPSLDINLRNHRKIAVIDGCTGFFGGTNIDSRHLLDEPGNLTPTEDLHFELHGPAVAELQALFVRDWHMATGRTLRPPQPDPEACGGSYCRLIDDGPDDSLNHLAMTLIGVFAAARERITIMMPYFLPHHDMVAALQSATLRGVRVRLLLPERSNLPYVDWATRNMLWELILWDVEVYYKPAPFAHTKLIAVDGHYAMGGSANLDSRSLRLNFELGMEIFDPTLAGKLEAHMNANIARGRAVTLAELDGRPFWQRLRDAFFWLGSSYL